MTVVETDARSRAVLPGHPGQTFQMIEQHDGSLLLVPARFTSDAQHEFDTTPALQTLLTAAAGSPTVRRQRRRSA